PNVPGVDTLYAACSNPTGLRKYSLVNGTWTLIGVMGSSSDIEQVTARLESDGSATVFVWREGSIYRITDLAPYNGALLPWPEAPYITPTTACGTGDMNNDGVTNISDVQPFVEALVNPASFQANHPGVPLLRGDMNCDGQLDGRDIQAFVSALIGSSGDGAFMLGGFDFAPGS
ncbi:MAG TPA: hypothetical protein VMV94_14815, partial [Phycisphaerae bacterium]|nr:hypothetical protein [Phycisphaerae bacterium]